MSELEEKAKALQIILNLDPEEGLDDYVTYIQCGASGEYDGVWDKEKLKELFGVNDEYEKSPFAKLAEATEKEYWNLQGEILKHETLCTLVSRLVGDIDNERIDLDGHTMMAIRTYIKD